MADSNIALTTFTTGALTVAALNWLKGSQYFPWITKEKTTLLRWLSAVAAVAASAGIGHVWNAADHSITISGLTLPNIVTFAWGAIKQFAMNETLFQVTKKPPTNIEQAGEVKANVAVLGGAPPK